MRDLTPSQLAVLRAVDDSWRPRPQIATRAGERHGWTGSIDGLNQTLGSLVRRGLLQRQRHQGRMQYRVTEKGTVTARSYRDTPAQTHPAGGER